MIAQKVFEQCLANGLTIAFAESMTGGALAYEMIKNPGSSHVISGSIIAYNIEQKNKILGISLEDIKTYGIVSKHIAIEMATAVRKLMNTNIGVAVTGNAGPEKQESTSNLEAWIAIDFNGDVKAFNLKFNHLTRLEAIRKTVRLTYQKLNQSL
ncbi:MAG: CinA family protein [Acholeplasmataceae bacterium]|nr:CinA family protein [Acholeplasmataceae bacterium]